MALSNIFRELRREITETAVGLLVAVPLFAFDWWFSIKLPEWTACTPADYGAPPCAPFIINLLLVSPVCLLFLLLLGTGMAVAIHAAGEGLCDAMERHGLRLRPRR